MKNFRRTPVARRRGGPRLELVVGLAVVLGWPGALAAPTLNTASNVEGSSVGSMEIVRALPGVASLAGPQFESLSSAQTGVNLVYQFPANAPFEFLQDQGCAGGVCLGDYDGDGYPDIYLTHYNRGNRLFRNLGHWRFEDVTAKAGVGGNGGWSAGASFVDIDNDGDLDLYVCVFDGPNCLYVNQGDGTFREEGTAYGLSFSGASVMMAFADYDLDGRLDGYLVTHRLNVGKEHLLPKTSQDAFRRSILAKTGPGRAAIDPKFEELFALMDRGEGRTELIIAGQRDYLFHNDGPGRFSIANAKAGIQGFDIGLAATWWDYNDDALPDIYVSNDYKGPDRLYRNNGDGTFTDVARTALPHVPWSSMGADAADIDNDGRVDFLAADMAGSTRARAMFIDADLAKETWFLRVSDPPQYRQNAVYLGTGADQVREAAGLTGLAATDWTWSPKFADLDNDGWVDLFICNGMSRDFMDSDFMMQARDRGSRRWAMAPVLREENLAFRNLGNLQFQNVGKAWGLDHRSASFGCAIGDLDRDGNLDLVVANFEGPVSIYRNRGSTGHRLLLRLKGTRSNSWGIGAKVDVVTAAGRQARCLSLASGFMSANEPVLHFGLGEATRVDELTVRWPNQRIQIFRNVDADREYLITEPSEPPAGSPAVTETKRWFAPVESPTGVRHREQPFDDFQREPLLPWKLSQLGPGLAVADVNGDGRDDFYLSGAAGQSGTLSLNEGRGRFRPQAMACLDDAKGSEEMAALFFDADGDGDADLFVVSGGIEVSPGDVSLRDHLYFNDGHGQFSAAPTGALPDLRDSGSCVVSADFDRDGDLDLFVGSRCVAGKYGEIPESRLLRNVSGRFEDVTDAVAPELRHAGLVTGAVWSDVDNDGWVDLLVTQEWGPVKLFANDHGQLRDRTEGAGLDRWKGFWNGIAGQDLNHDGAIDYVVSNLGLNTKYKASQAEPALAFLVPVRNEVAFIEATVSAETLYPVRGRSSFLSFWPALIEKFPTLRSFATASLKELVPEQLLNEARRLEVNTLETGVLWNDGHGRFTFRPLPRIAQIAPTFGMATTDWDGDGHPDIYLVQNSHRATPETGPMDGGLSQLLAGQADGGLTCIEPKASGLIVPGKGRSAAVSDLDGDGRPDLLVGRNDGAPLVFTNGTPSAERILTVRLVGRPGNAAAIGARVTVARSDGLKQCDEARAGGGYLSQSSSRLFFGLGRTNQAVSVTIRWPDGSSSTRPLDPNAREATIRQPASVHLDGATGGKL